MRVDVYKRQGAWILWEKIKKAGQVPQEAVFNLSHSGDYVLCAYSDVAKAQVGCDLEEVKELRLSVARRFFGEREYRHIACLLYTSSPFDHLLDPGNIFFCCAWFQYNNHR